MKKAVAKRNPSTSQGSQKQKTSKSKTAKKAVPTKRVSALLNPQNTELHERLEDFVVEKNGHDLKDLAEAIGVGKLFFTTSKRRNNAIGSDKLMKILKHYPELSADWLLRGTGAMLVGLKTDDDVKYRFAMSKLLSRLDTVVGDLSDTVDSTTGIIQKMKKTQKEIGLDW